MSRGFLVILVATLTFALTLLSNVHAISLKSNSKQQQKTALQHGERAHHFDLLRSAHENAATTAAAENGTDYYTDLLNYGNQTDAFDCFKESWLEYNAFVVGAHLTYKNLTLLCQPNHKFYVGITECAIQYYSEERLEQLSENCYDLDTELVNCSVITCQEMWASWKNGTLNNGTHVINNGTDDNGGSQNNGTSSNDTAGASLIQTVQKHLKSTQSSKAEFSAGGLPECIEEALARYLNVTHGNPSNVTQCTAIRKYQVDTHNCQIDSLDDLSLVSLYEMCTDLTFDKFPGCPPLTCKEMFEKWIAESDVCVSGAVAEFNARISEASTNYCDAAANLNIAMFKCLNLSFWESVGYKIQCELGWLPVDYPNFCTRPSCSQLLGW